MEAESLKCHLVAFRNCAAFNEQVVNRILDDLMAAGDPWWMRVEGCFDFR